MRDILFPKRLGRLAYFIRAFPLNIAVLFGSAEVEDLSRASGADFAIFAGALALLVYGVFFVYLPRIRDAALPAWILVLAFIPYVDSALGFVLLFGHSKSAIRPRPELPESNTPSAAIPGSTCAQCGKVLVLVTDGVVVSANKTLCNGCNQS